MTRYITLFIITVLASVTLSGKAKIDILDFERTTGPVKPVNSVGQPPYIDLSNAEMFHYLTEAGVKYSRLHDVGGWFGRGVFVDIPNIFRNFDADENNPDSYDFTFTDLLLKNLVEAGIEPYYRLGVTIENSAGIKAYRIYPPEDFEKWARICEHIILHYNYGWANGFHFGISHWEIWNEPENLGDPMENPMWRGTFEQFMELYATAATHLKERFPDLMIGGYGSTGFGVITHDFNNPENLPKKIARKEYHLKCFNKFMKAASENHWPLDFFSFHSYSAVPFLLPQIQYARKALDDYGFKNTQLSLNEWLPVPSRDKLGTAIQAAEIAAAMLVFQNSPLNDAELYDARTSGGTYSPLFQPETYLPRRAYWSFRMFGELKALGVAVEMPALPKDLYGCAATDKNGNAAVMISNLSGKIWNNSLRWIGYSVESVTLLDDSHNEMYATKKSNFKKVKPNSVVLIKLKKK